MVHAGSFPLSGTSPLAAQELDIADAYFRSFEYERTDDFSNAVRALTPVLEAYPNGYTVNLRLGWLFYRNGNYSNAIAHYQAATTAAPFALEPKIGHLLPLMAQQRWAEAEVLAYQIVSMDHYNYYGNLRLATILRMQNELDAASQVAWKMAGAYPTDLLFMAELARIAVAQGDSDEAARLYTDLIILDPENQEARAFLGR